MPAIPWQRAIIVHRDQTETLVVESTLSAQGQRFGWILPVPATPIEMKEASAGLLNTLTTQTNPLVTHDLFESLLLVLLPAIFVTIWLLARLIEGHEPKKLRFSIRCALFLTFLLLTAYVMLPHLGASSISVANRLTPGVRIESARTIGNYEVMVLQADTPQSLNRWLDENGFAPLPAEGGPIVSKYITQNWHFVAAKLQREGEGLTRPHPLVITFPSKNAIYPMRLTALSGEPLTLELFVVGRQQAAANRMRVEFCDVLHARQGNDSTGKPVSGYVGEGTETVIHHPLLQGSLWDGCCVTRLTRVMHPTDMGSDIQIQWKTPSSNRDHFLQSSRGVDNRPAGSGVSLDLRNPCGHVGFPAAFCDRRSRLALVLFKTNHTSRTDRMQYGRVGCLSASSKSRDNHFLRAVSYIYVLLVPGRQYYNGIARRIEIKEESYYRGVPDSSC